jgi:hypothetical protein
MDKIDVSTIDPAVYKVNFANNLVFGDCKFLMARFISSILNYHVTSNENVKMEFYPILSQLQAVQQNVDDTFKHYVMLAACCMKILGEKDEKNFGELITLMLRITEELKYIDYEFMSLSVLCMDYILFGKQLTKYSDDCLKVVKEVTKHVVQRFDSSVQENMDSNKLVLKIVCFAFDLAWKINFENTNLLFDKVLGVAFEFDHLNNPNVFINASFFSCVSLCIDYFVEVFIVSEMSTFDKDHSKKLNLIIFSREICPSILKYEHIQNQLIANNSSFVNNSNPKIKSVIKRYFQLKKMEKKRLSCSHLSHSALKIQKEIISRKTKKCFILFLEQNFQAFIQSSLPLILQLLVLSLKYDKRSKSLDIRLIKMLVISFMNINCYYESCVLLQFFDISVGSIDFKTLLDKSTVHFNIDLLAFIFDINLIEDLIEHNFMSKKNKILNDALMSLVNSPDVLKAKTIEGARQVELFKIFDFVNYLSSSSLFCELEFHIKSK